VKLWIFRPKKRKEEEKLQEQQKSSHTLFVPAQQEKRQEKEKKGFRPIHIKNHPSLLFLSNRKLRKYFVKNYGWRIGNYHY